MSVKRQKTREAEGDDHKTWRQVRKTLEEVDNPEMNADTDGLQQSTNLREHSGTGRTEKFKKKASKVLNQILWTDETYKLVSE